MLYFDLEADGFLESVTRIHCIAISDSGKDPVLYHGSDVAAAVAILKQADSICAHNGIGYDCPVIQKLYGVNLSSKCIDTLVLSCLVNPEREGGHSLANISGCKDDYDGGWDQYNDEMGQYCKQDVRALVRVHQIVQEEMKGHDWSVSVRLEHQVARLISWQERNGWQFDVEGCKELITVINKRIDDTDRMLFSMLTPKIVKKGAEVVPYTAAGKPSARATKWATENSQEFSIIGGKFSPVEVKYPDLGSRKQMIELLQNYGWKPTEYTEKGNPRFTEDSIVGKLGDEGQALVDRFVAVTRRGQLTGWLEKVRADGRISAGARPNATPTARMRHRTVVNVPRVTSAYGNELRQLFTVPDGHCQVGADASGLELRMLAHYMGDAEYTDAVVNGKSADETDVHSVNCKLIGLEPKKQYVINGKQTSGRDIAKTFILTSKG